MKTFLRWILPLLLLLRLSVLAQVEPGAGTEHPSTVVNLLFGLLPFLMLGLILFWWLRRYGNTPHVRRTQEYMARSQEHMDRMEALMERQVSALERLTKGGS